MDEKTSIFDRMSKWLSQPFNSQGSALNWVLFVGLLIVGVWMWNHILTSLTDD